MRLALQPGPHLQHQQAYVVGEVDRAKKLLAARLQDLAQLSELLERHRALGAPQPFAALDYAAGAGASTYALGHTGGAAPYQGAAAAFQGGQASPRGEGRYSPAPVYGDGGGYQGGGASAYQARPHHAAAYNSYSSGGGGYGHGGGYAQRPNAGRPQYPAGGAFGGQASAYTGQASAFGGLAAGQGSSAFSAFSSGQQFSAAGQHQAALPGGHTQRAAPQLWQAPAWQAQPLALPAQAQERATWPQFTQTLPLHC